MTRDAPETKVTEDATMITTTTHASKTTRFHAPLRHAGHWLDGRGPRDVIAFAILAAIPALIWRFAGDLSFEGRVVATVFLCAIVGWTLTRLGDALVAALAALALVATGVVRTDALFGALGHELVWLLIAAFALAAVIKSTGLAEAAVGAIARHFRTTAGLFHGLALAISATAFLIPSTSGRAALLLPVFLALATALGDDRRIKALALLFPTAILLSAVGSIIGAGAHLVALDFVDGLGGRRPSFLGWAMLGVPFALATTHAGTALILRLFLDRRERVAPVTLPTAAPGAARRNRGVLTVVAGTVALWITEPLHGVPMAIVALVGALVATLPAVSGVDLKKALKSVEWDLLIFMAFTVMLGKALVASDLDDWAMRRLALLFVGGAPSPVLVAMLLAAVATLSHLVVTSRTARALVLLPSFALPLAAIGFDPLAVALIIVAGTGFCQTMTASAKPVALYASLERPTYDERDLARLAVPLYPVMFGLLLLFALVVWPLMGVPLIRG
jgi:di/tricarboxylate transporter